PGVPQATLSYSPPAKLETFQLYVWNRARRDICLRVSVGKNVVFDDVVKASFIASSIDGGAVIQLPAGTYTVHVTDFTRKIDDELTVNVSNDAPNVGINLTDIGLAFVVTRQAYLAEFTPPFQGARNR